MMKLTTKSFGSVDCGMAVSWRVGTKRKGIIIVQGIKVENDRQAAAELVAIRYLLFTKKIFMRNIVSGIGYALEYSSPVIKKLYHGKSTKIHLKQYAHYLKTNLSGVVLSNTNKSDEFLPIFGDDVITEYVDAEKNPRIDIIATPALGEVRLTKHSIEQYEKRLNAKEIKNPVVSLIGCLKHPNLKLKLLPEKAKQHKRRKYGNVDNLEIWGHDFGGLNYVVVRDPGTHVGTLVTVYSRHSYKE
jgi:hypothetical protein